MSDELHHLFSSLENARRGSLVSPRTNKLVSSGREKLAKKVGEEAVEVVVASVSNDTHETICETVDLVYNLAALLVDMSISWDDIIHEMQRRRLSLGISEKLPKTKSVPLKKTSSPKTKSTSPRRKQKV